MLTSCCVAAGADNSHPTGTVPIQTQHSRQDAGLLSMPIAIFDSCPETLDDGDDSCLFGTLDVVPFQLARMYLKAPCPDLVHPPELP